jgi:thiol-disulfide isomerase/thioredoxin
MTIQKATNMKNIFIVFILFLAFAGCGQSSSDPAILKGKLSSVARTERLDLNKIENGNLVPVASSIPDEEGSFSFMVNISTPGLYVLTLHNKEGARMNADHWLNRFWLKSGEVLELELTDNNYRLVSSEGKENRLLSEWNGMVDTVFTYAYPFGSNTTFREFFPLLPDYVKMSEEFAGSVKTGNRKFDEFLKFIVETDMAFAATYFLLTPRTAHPEPVDFPEYYHTLAGKDFFSTTRLLETPHGIRLLTLYPYIWYRLDIKDAASTDFSGAKKIFLNEIKNDTLKGFLMVEDIRRFRTYDESYVKFSEEVAPYLLTPYLKDKVASYELSIRKFETGSIAYDFAGTDITGKEFKLSDFKGKLVYVDVWATWCAPCKAEIPFLKTLEEDYHNKDVVFLSISVDPPADREKWIKFVKDENLKGVQIMADKAFESDVAKPYGINAIPRFMLFGKDGKVLTIDAPRPSNNAIRDMLNKYLQI